MSAAEAEWYHGAQIETFAGTAADMVAALTLTNAEEATGIARAAARAGLPVAISFTVETDGRLASGQVAGRGRRGGRRATDGYPSYFMVNCAHPSHFGAVLDCGEPWIGARARSARQRLAPEPRGARRSSPSPTPATPRSSGRSTRRSSGGCRI